MKNELDLDDWIDSDSADESYIEPKETESLDIEEDNREPVTIEHDEVAESSGNDRRGSSGSKSKDEVRRDDAQQSDIHLEDVHSAGSGVRRKKKASGGPNRAVRAITLGAVIAAVLGGAYFYKKEHSQVHGAFTQPVVQNGSEVRSQAVPPVPVVHHVPKVTMAHHQASATIDHAGASNVQASRVPTSNSMASEVPTGAGDLLPNGVPGVGGSPFQPEYSANSQASSNQANLQIVGAVSGLKDQLAVIETQLKELRSAAPVKEAVQKSDEKISARIKDMKSSISYLKSQINMLSKKMTTGTVKHPVLYGYKLLSVIGDQAVIENLSSGDVKVLKANDGIGAMTVYQVTPRQVVTNYGVFSVQ